MSVKFVNSFQGTLVASQGVQVSLRDYGSLTGVSSSFIGYQRVSRELQLVLEAFQRNSQGFQEPFTGSRKVPVGLRGASGVPRDVSGVPRSILSGFSKGL